MFTKRSRQALVKAIITKRSPLYVQYAVTKHCNLNCRMCGASESRKNETDLTLAQVQQLAGVLDKLNAGIILLTGGEPFIRADIAGAIQAFASKGFTVRLQTNGLLASEDKIKAACEAGLAGVTISLDSLDPQKQDLLSGQTGSWQKIIAAIARFSQQLPLKGTVLGINTVVSKLNLAELPDIVRFVTKIGFYVSLIPIHLSAAGQNEFVVRKYMPDLAFSPEDFEKIDRIFKTITDMKRQGYAIYNSFYFLRQAPNFLKGKRINWPCDSPDLYFAISPSGNFLPCVDINWPVPMLDNQFVDLYNSAAFKSGIRQKVSLCPGCFYPCWPEITMLCRNPVVLAERVLLGAKMWFSRRKPVTYEQCLAIIKGLSSKSSV